MIAQQNNDVERKTIAILKILRDSPKPLGGRILARRLVDLGIELGERSVRYHLKMMDERGLTHPARQKDGRVITQSGIEELSNALISDRINLVATKIGALNYRSSFDTEKCSGEVPINVSLFLREEFDQVIKAMKDIFQAGLGIGDLVAIAYEGEKLGDVIIPPGRIGLATLSHIILSGILLRAGISVDFKFGGILQIQNQEALRFTHLMEYAGCSLDPSEVFTAGKMTSVAKTAREGNGKVLASFCEVPAVAHSDTEVALRELEKAGIQSLVVTGRIGKSVCQIPVTANRFGMVLVDGLNPVAVAMEAGLKVINYSMSGTIEFEKLRHLKDCRLI